ncbi:MtrAB system histidine kinase MtrB [Gephyromycinifex aptenodytis]|uniref:MtrAB system histidine kinase MtrB n=1 Tax=Gephyromycinifex aptenodytis TaxID=2716227 RepID=UPI001D027AEC|nr:MtrAB system histidine kinase MtrB [Gephyromycinifex aptenodytis]
MATESAQGARPARGQRLVQLLRRWAHRVGRLWRVSLHFRVVAMTVLLGLGVTVLLQTFLYDRIADGLVQGRIATAKEEAAYGARDLQRGLDATDKTDIESLRQFTYDLVRQQETQTPDQSRELILTRAVDNRNGPTRVPTFYTGLDPSILPDELRQAIAKDPAHQQVQIVPVPMNGQQVPAVVVGSQVMLPEVGAHELYYVFPLEREQRTMALVWRVFVVGSIALVALVGLVAFVVTRIVVDPVRQAAEVAGRLSSGHLNERMLVKGEDDIAALAMAFNGMADHLQAQIRQLEDLSRVQQRFVSDVSHELRTPLTTIRMAAELIHDQRQSFDPVVARSTELLHAQVGRFEELLSDLLEISRFDAGGAVLDVEDVDLRVVVARALTSVETLAAAKGSVLTVSGDQEPRIAAVDARRVERILRNLLVNAVEHGEGQPVRVEMASDPTSVAVAVRDYGIGLNPGEAALVFNRFWRADPSRKRTTGGTGLGLAIALEDARLHRGWLQAWGEPGQGARFRLTLPRIAADSLTHSPLPLRDLRLTTATKQAAADSDEGGDEAEPRAVATPADLSEATETAELVRADERATVVQTMREATASADEPRQSDGQEMRLPAPEESQPKQAKDERA